LRSTKRPGPHIDLIPSLVQDILEGRVVVDLLKDRTPPDRAVQRVIDISSR
jgi:hypothetical protein